MRSIEGVGNNSGEAAMYKKINMYISWCLEIGPFPYFNVLGEITSMYIDMRRPYTGIHDPVPFRYFSGSEFYLPSLFYVKIFCSLFV